MFAKKIHFNKSLKKKNKNYIYKIKNQKEIGNYYTEKKNIQEKNFDKNNLKYIKIDADNSINQIINNKIKYQQYKQKNNIYLYNNRLMKNIKNNSKENSNINKNDNIRYSLNIKNNKINDKKESFSNNIKIIDINNSLNNYIYKKKVKLSGKNVIFNRNNNNYNTNNSYKSNKTNKTEANKRINNIEGKIIDIDINLGKPIKEIRDISSLDEFFINNYSSKDYITSYSSNNKEKHKKKHKIKKLSLPKKKYLEKGYDIMPSTNEKEEEIMTEYRTNSYEYKKNYYNNLINLNNSMNLNIDNKIRNNQKFCKVLLIKNIVTSDKRLFIHINYIFYNNSNITKKNYYHNRILKIEISDSFSIFNNIQFTRYKIKRLSNNSLLGNHSRNNFLKNDKYKTNYIQNKKDKYLISCIKFLIKAINKIFLKKAYAHYKKCINYK